MRAQTITDNEQGQVKITIWNLTEFAYDKPITVCTYLPDPYSPEHDIGRTAAAIPSNGSAEFGISFNLKREPFQKMAELLIQDAAENDLAKGEFSLKQLLIDRVVPRTSVKLEPRGIVEIEMFWVEAPKNPTKYFQISRFALSDLVERNVDPFIIVLVDDTEVGRTETQVGGGGQVDFKLVVDRPYALYSSLTLLVCDEARGEEDPIGETTTDLWPLFKTYETPCVEGWIRLYDLSGQLAGKVKVMLNFYNDEYEKDRAPAKLDELDKPAEPAPQILSSIASASSSSLSEHPQEPVPPSPAVLRAIDDAQKAADAAEQEAAKAREIAQLLDDTPMTAPEAKDNARQAQAAADSAKAAAKKARQIADDLQNDPNLQNPIDADRCLKDVTDAARDAKAGKEKTNHKAKDAASISAREDAKQARESARKAARYGDDTHNLAANYPNVKQFVPLCAEADNATQEADHEAVDAKDFADVVDKTSKLHEALENAKQARRAAVRAKGQEDEAEEIARKAQMLAKKADKAVEKLQRKRIEDEEAASKRAADEREKLRAAEHEADQARRRANLHNNNSAEPDVYQIAATLGFHSDPPPMESLPPPAANWTVCCSRGPPVDRNDSLESLRGGIPTYELRGQEAPNPKQEYNPAAPFPLLEGDGMVESRFVGRPACWCFGCGCCRCCGEC